MAMGDGGWVMGDCNFCDLLTLRRQQNLQRPRVNLVQIR
jgi:hypothetical protein